jgi:transketolase
MKKQFFDYFIRLMRENPDIYFISAGLGWPRTDEIKEKFPDRYIQTEASEQTALDIAVGLAYSGKSPWVYTITPFLLRGLETIRTYIDHEKLNVTMVGVGVDDDYKHDGFSHYAGDVPKILGVLNNLELYQPRDEEELIQNMNMIVNLRRPTFLNVKR